jgi:hypothetical protein
MKSGECPCRGSHPTSCHHISSSRTSNGVWYLAWEVYTLPCLVTFCFSSFITGCSKMTVAKKNSMVWVRERTIPTEQPPLVGEVIANFCG